MRNELFFFVVILGAAALVVLREYFSGKRPAEDAQLNPAERRKRDWEFRRQRRWSFAAAILCILVVMSLAAEFVYTRATNAQEPAKLLVAENNQVRIPLADLQDTAVHFYTADVNDTVIRFLVIHLNSGDYATALDACQICGTAGYRQEGQNVVCRNCGATIYLPSIGESGGCNPIPVKSRVDAGAVIVDLSALASAMSTIHP